jgi:hypothetical protein
VSLACGFAGLYSLWHAFRALTLLLSHVSVRFLILLLSRVSARSLRRRPSDRLPGEAAAGLRPGLGLVALLYCVCSSIVAVRDAQLRTSLMLAVDSGDSLPALILKRYRPNLSVPQELSLAPVDRYLAVTPAGSLHASGFVVCRPPAPPT